MSLTKHLQLRVTKERFIPLDVAYLPDSWFTDAHLQEILVAIGDSFMDIYNLTTPRVYRTPRCSFSVTVSQKSFKSYAFIPENETNNFEALSSMPKIISVRVLGRADVAEKLPRQTTLDGAFRVVPK